MEPGIKSAQKELDKYGIKSVAFNTEEDDTVCHIIGHKQIYANINYDTSDNTNGGANNATFGVYKNVSGSGLERGLVGMIHPVYGPMIIITAFLLLLDDIQKLFGKH